MNFELNQDWLKGDLPGLQEAEGLNNKRIHSNQSNIQAMSINKGHSTGSSWLSVFAVAPSRRDADHHWFHKPFVMWKDKSDYLPLDQKSLIYI